jgi:hypothetical protein
MTVVRGRVIYRAADPPPPSVAWAFARVEEAAERLRTPT